MTKIVFLDNGTIGPGITMRRPAFEHDWIGYDRTAPGEVVERLAYAAIAITNKVPIDETVLAELPDLKHVAWASVGGMQTLANQLIDNIESFMAGTPRNLVT